VAAADGESEWGMKEGRHREYMWMKLHGLRTAEQKLAEDPENPVYQVVTEAAASAVVAYARECGYIIRGPEPPEQERH
jgi:hypothetical protein